MLWRASPQVQPIFMSRRKFSNRNGKPFRNLPALAVELAPDRLFFFQIENFNGE